MESRKDFHVEELASEGMDSFRVGGQIVQVFTAMESYK